MSGISGATYSQVSEHFRIELEIVRDFADFGLYPTVLIDGEPGIEAGEMERLRKVIGLHQALGINKEGIEAVLALRARIAGLEGEIEDLKREALRLKRRLRSEEAEPLERLGLFIEVDSP
jgi:hypothetical protein